MLEKMFNSSDASSGSLVHDHFLLQQNEFFMKSFILKSAQFGKPDL